MNGRVWIDTGGDGIQNSQEIGAAGVAVTLIGAGPDGVFGTADDTAEAAFTYVNGAYTFMVVDGEYKLAFGGKTGYMYTVQNAGGHDATDSDADTITGKSHVFTLGVGQSETSVDAGQVLRALANAVLGDLVWLDSNGDGVQNIGEAGAAGVTVRLIGAGTDGAFGTGDDTVLATTSTDTDGHYSFTGLAPGQYQVEFAATSGYGFTTRDTDHWFQNVEQNGNILGETSTATRTDGTSIEMIDAYFKYEEVPALDSLVEADNALLDSVLGGGSAREMPAIADIAFDAAGEAQRVIAAAIKQADESLAAAV